MKILGIDYGRKRIGLAASDENQKLAFPHSILPNDEDALGRLAEIVRKENIAELVVGESTDFAGKANQVAAEIENFEKILAAKFGLPLHRQKEFLTTVEARRYQTGGARADASAAALILQRYLDKIGKKS